MNRRLFVKSAVLATPFLITGCSFNFIESKQEILDKNNSLLATIDYIQIFYKKGLRKMEDLNFSLINSNQYIGANYTLPWYVGPNISLDKNEYLLKTYNQEPLLFNGFGIKNRLNMDLPNKGLSKIGYSSIEQLYSIIFDKITSYSKYEVFAMIEKLEEDGILNKGYILDLRNVELHTEKLLRKKYEFYINYETSMALSDTDRKFIDNNLINPKWKFRVGDKLVTLNKEDYLIYGLVSMICEQIIKENKKINVI